MRVESPLDIGNKLIDSDAPSGALAYQHDGTKWVPIIGTQGDILYKGATLWEKLTPGTSGHFLKTQGAGADPGWAAAPSSVSPGPIPLTNSVVNNTWVPMMGAGHGIYWSPTGTAVVGGSANVAIAWPWMPPYSCTIDNIGLTVLTSVASSNVKVGLYGVTANNWPGANLYETSSISTASTGAKTTAVNWSITGGQIYWVSMRFSHSSLNLLGPYNGCYGFGYISMPTTNGPLVKQSVATSQTFASALDPWPAPDFTGGTATNPMVWGQINA